MAVVIIMIKRMTVVEKVEKLEKLVVKEILLQLVNF
jgi:hypothetical protein